MLTADILCGLSNICRISSKSLCNNIFFNYISSIIITMVIYSGQNIVYLYVHFCHLFIYKVKKHSGHNVVEISKVLSSQYNDIIWTLCLTVQKQNENSNIIWLIKSSLTCKEGRTRQNCCFWSDWDILRILIPVRSYCAWGAHKRMRQEK